MSAGSLLRCGCRAGAVLLLIVGGMATACLLRGGWGADWMRRPPGISIIRAWMRLVAATLGVRIMTEGKPAAVPALLVANHVSWLDVIVIGCVMPSSFVAKQEVRHWPVLGSLVGISGTLFLKRGSVASLRTTIRAMAARLQRGHGVVIFPEGTTSVGRELLPFHAGLFKAAVVSKVPVQPLALRYVRDGELDSIAPFLGETTFLSHILALMLMPQTCVTLSICTALEPATASSNALAAQARAAIQQTLSRHEPIDHPCGEVVTGVITTNG